MEKNTQQKITRILSFIYVIILTWIIVFKMQFSWKDMPHFRNVNGIPFGGSAIVNGEIDFDEIIDNVLVFVPLGVYISLLKKDGNFWKKIFPIFLLSLAYEVTQYIFAIGATDITDLIANTLGGILGIVVYEIFLIIFKREDKIQKILNTLAIIGTTLILALTILLLLMN